MPHCLRRDLGLVSCGKSLEDCFAGGSTGVGGGVYYARRGGGSQESGGERLLRMYTILLGEGSWVSSALASL